MATVITTIPKHFAPPAYFAGHEDALLWGAHAEEIKSQVRRFAPFLSKLPGLTTAKDLRRFHID